MSQQDKSRTIYVTEFKNQFDQWQLLHATRSKDKAYNDVGRTGRVVELIEKLAYDKLEAALREAIEALKYYEQLSFEDDFGEKAEEALERIRKVMG